MSQKLLLQQLVESVNKEEMMKMFNDDKEINELSHEQLLNILLVGFAKHKKEATETLAKQYDIEASKLEQIFQKLKDTGSKLYDSMNSGQLEKLRYIQSVQHDQNLPGYLKPYLHLINMELVTKINPELQKQSTSSGKKQQKINQPLHQEQYPEHNAVTEDQEKDNTVYEQAIAGSSQHKRRRHQKVSE